MLDRNTRADCEKKRRANRNRTITLSPEEIERYDKELSCLSGPLDIDSVNDRIINQDIFQAFSFLPDSFIDLLVLDPPYNLTKTFASSTFRKKTIAQYTKWFENLFIKLLPTLKRT